MSKLTEMDGVMLLDVLDLADVLDVKASEIRQRLVEDPTSLPLPLVFTGSGLVRWPAQQIVAWGRARCPRNWVLSATNFVPASVAQFHNPAALAKSDPTSPVSDLRAVAAALYGEPAVTYPED